MFISLFTTAPPDSALPAHKIPGQDKRGRVSFALIVYFHGTKSGKGRSNAIMIFPVKWLTMSSMVWGLL